MFSKFFLCATALYSIHNGLFAQAVLRGAETVPFNGGAEGQASVDQILQFTKKRLGLPATGAFALVVASGSASDLSTETLPPARLPAAAITGGTISGAAISGGTVSGAAVAGGSFAGTAADAATVLESTNSARENDVINVLDHGVVCDGATDNAPFFAALNTLLGPGKTAYFPPSNSMCLTSAPWSVPDGTMLLADKGSVFLGPTPSNTASTLLLSIINPTSVTVYGLGLDGGGQDFGNGASLAVTYNSLPGGSRGSVFDHVVVRNTRGLGIEFSNGVGYSGVRNSIFQNIGNHWKTTLLAADRKASITFDATGPQSQNINNFVVGNQMSDIGLDGVSWSLQTNFLATHNQIDQTNNQVALAAFPDYPGAFFSVDSINSKIDNNIVKGSAGNCIDSDGANIGLSITNNSVSYCGARGINLGGNSSHALVTGNSALNNGQAYAIELARNPAADPNYRPAGIGLGIGGLGHTYNYVTIAGNDASDTQSIPTQRYGVVLPTGNTFTAVWIDKSNILIGNVNGAIGGTVTAFSTTK